MNLYEILGILLVHWFADFVMQTDKMAQGKSKNWSDLISHTWTYCSIWWCFGIVAVVVNIYYPFFIYKSWSLSLFTLITFIAHTITDYITSRENSKLWEAKKIHNFFVCIGFDQWLHYVQLFITYWYLTK